MGIALKSARCNNIVMPGLKREARLRAYVPGIHVFGRH